MVKEGSHEPPGLSVSFVVRFTRALAQTPVELVRVEPHSHTRCALASLGTNDSDPWGSCLVIWYKNTSSQRIAGIRFDVHYVSALKEVDPVACSYESTAIVKPGKVIGGIWHDGVFWHQYGDGMDAEVSVGRVMFADGTFWTSPATLPGAPTPTTLAAAEPSKPLDQSAARQLLLKAINDQFAKGGVAGYAEVSGDKLTVHSERASAMRFRMTVASERFISMMQDAGIATFLYTNDAEQSFVYDVKASKITLPVPQAELSKQ